MVTTKIGSSFPYPSKQIRAGDNEDLNKGVEETHVVSCDGIHKSKIVESNDTNTLVRSNTKSKKKIKNKVDIDTLDELIHSDKNRGRLCASGIGGLVTHST